MNFKYLLIPFILCTIYLNAQTRFAARGAKWCTSTMYMSGTETHNPFYATDSIVNNIPCSYIPYFGCVYVLNDTVYNIQYDNGSTEFLYDYSAQAGDKWLLKNLHYRMYNYDSLIPLVVDSIRKTILAGDTLRLIYTHGDTLNGNDYMGYMLGTLLEGVGSTTRTFRPGPWGWYDSGIPSVKCYSDSIHGAIRTWDQQQLDSCSCRLSTGINNLLDEHVNISYSLNYKQINVDFMKHLAATVYIYNIQGQQLRMDDVRASSHVINTHSYTPGIYLCTVVIDGYKPYTKKIVIQQ